MQVLAVGLGTSINGTNLPQELLYVLSGAIEINSFQGRVSGIEYQYFRNTLALPLIFCNINFFADQPYVPDTLIVNGYLAKDVCRLVISNYSLYIFTILAIVAIIWCAGVIVYCWVFGALAPNLSLFPEIDFASKSTGRHR